MADDYILRITMEFAEDIWHFEIMETNGPVGRAGYAFGTRDSLKEILEAVESNVQRILTAAGQNDG